MLNKLLNGLCLLLNGIIEGGMTSPHYYEGNPRETSTRTNVEDALCAYWEIGEKREGIHDMECDCILGVNDAREVEGLVLLYNKIQMERKKVCLLLRDIDTQSTCLRADLVYPVQRVFHRIPSPLYHCHIFTFHELLSKREEGAQRPPQGYSMSRGNYSENFTQVMTTYLSGSSPSE